jgi:hypothetical protein
MAITIDGTNGLSSDNAALKLDGTTLVVDEANNRVGVGTASPAVAMDVVGQVRASTGILFGSDTAAANALDDYEEGDWTPTVVSGSGTITAYTATGRYTKIGRVAIVRAQVTLTTVGTAGGFLEINNLPFTAIASVLFSGYGRERQTTGNGLSIDYKNQTAFLWQKYDGTFLGANGYVYLLTVIYEVA